MMGWSRQVSLKTPEAQLKTSAMEAWTAGLTSVEAAGVIPLVVDAVGCLGHQPVRLRAGGYGADIALLGGIVPAQSSLAVSLAVKRHICDHA